MPIISISTTTASMPEGNTGAKIYTFTVTRTGDVSTTSSVDWKVEGSGANPAGLGTDIYSDSGASAGIINFAIGETTRTIDIRIIGDTSFEEDEQFTVSLSNPSNATFNIASAIGVIANDDVAPIPKTFSITALDADKSEGNGGFENWTPFTFQIKREGDISQVASVHWDVPSVDFGIAQPEGSGLADRYDFKTVALDGNINFAAGESSKIITIEVNSDLTAEANESFLVRLSQPIGATIKTSDAFGIIRNDDYAINIASSNASVQEGNSGTTIYEFTVTRSNNLNQPASVNWTATGTGNFPATIGSDIQSGIDNSNGIVNFAIGETSKTIQIKVLGDTTPESNEQFVVTLTNPIGGVLGKASEIGTIINDDAVYNSPKLSITSLSANKYEGDSGSTPFTFQVSRTGDVTNSSSVRWWIPDLYAGQSNANPSDLYLFTSGASGTVSFSPGQTNATITIGINGDTTIEPDELFSVLLIDAVGAQIEVASASGTIKNDDGIATATLSPNSISKPESNSNYTIFQYVLNRSGNLSGSASVNWRIEGQGTNPANIISDFSADSISGIVTFGSGESTKTIDIKVLGDVTMEENETFQLILSNPNGISLSNAVATGIIENDDVFQNFVSITIFDANKFEGNAGTTPMTFAISRTGDLTIPASVDWSVANNNNDDKSLASSSDFVPDTLPRGTVNFNIGQSTATITIQVAGDLSYENDENFTVSLNNAIGAQIKNGNATGRIINDDPIAPTISVNNTSISQYEGNSGSTAYIFILTRTGDLQKESSITWDIVGAGTNPIDLDDIISSGTTLSSLSTGTTKFSSGQENASITVNIRTDNNRELNEQFNLVISNPINAVIGAKSVTASVINDDYTGNLIIVGNPTIGTKLKVESSVDFGQGITLSGYQWQANGKDIPGATTESFTPSQDELGKTISFIANYAGSAGLISIKSTSTNSITKNNNLPTGKITIQGEFQQGNNLKAVNNLQDLDGLGTISYIWKVDNVLISEVSGDSLQLTDKHVGKSVSVTATYTDGLGNKESLSSVPSPTVSGFITGGFSDDVLVGSKFDDLIRGNQGNDMLFGNEGNDTINGNDGNDILTGGSGNDRLVGDAGFDIAVFSGKLSDYNINLRDGSIIDNRGIDGNDYFSSIETLKFSDKSVHLGISTEFNSLLLATAKSLVELYIAFFQRVPDANGLAYWISEVKNGKSIEQIASSFYDAGIQFSNLTGFKPDMSNADFINTIYQNVLGRSQGADAEGMTYWQKELSSGHATRGSLVISILDAAHTFKGNATFGYVADLLDNRYIVAKRVSVDWGISYNNNEQNITKSIEALALVTPTDITHALEVIGISSTNIMFV